MTLKIVAFKSAKEFQEWLHANHDQSEGVWLRFFKKGSGKICVGRAAALDLALCYGWIDGQGRPHDELSWLQKFTPRRAKSGWSKINTGHVERLIQSGQMHPAGLKAMEEAKADGRWQAAYESQRNAAAPHDFLKALAKNKKARAFFKTLTKANIYSIVYRLQTAKKPETRARQMQMILEMLDRGETFHPQSARSSSGKTAGAKTK